MLVYHPHTRQTHVVASGFHYCDGVAVSEDGSYLLVVETDALRVVKVWLSGDKVLSCLCLVVIELVVGLADRTQACIHVD